VTFRLKALVLGSAIVAAREAAAQEDPDLNLLPKEVIQEQSVPSAAGPAPKMLRAQAFIQEAIASVAPATTVPVAYPTTLVFDWQNRISLDARLEFRPTPSFSAFLSDRLNVIAQPNMTFASWQTVQNNFREGYVSWHPTAGLYFEAGRINERNGVALGYNPTDFFKTRTLVGQASLDPSVIRSNRLGVLLFRAQALWSDGSASVLFAPMVANATPIDQTGSVGLDPRFDATNAENRVLAKLGFNVLDLNPQILAYYVPDRPKLGLNLSRPIGDAVVAYAEWAGGPEKNLTSRAVSFGQATGALPPTGPVLPSSRGGTVFSNDVAAGFSWTVANALTINAEYLFHQSGFSAADWASWFAAGTAPGASPTLANELWYVRAYASDQQEPTSKHQTFLRVDWPRAFVTDLELGAFALVDLTDGSLLTQFSASYYLSNAWTLAGFVSAEIGAARSDWGSFPQRESVTLQVTRYF
jgi:hypothetical protein